jgi:hydrogenase maturation protein HypF
VLARRFHSTVATVVVDTAAKLARARNLRVVALSGGVFQNRLLAARVEAALEAAGLSVLTHCLVPPNDGGISLGQAYLCTFPFPVR